MKPIHYILSLGLIAAALLTQTRAGRNTTGEVVRFVDRFTEVPKFSFEPENPELQLTKEARIALKKASFEFDDKNYTITIKLPYKVSTKARESLKVVLDANSLSDGSYLIQSIGPLTYKAAVRNCTVIQGVNPHISNQR